MYLSWKLVDRTSGATVGSATNMCSDKLLVSVPAGDYDLVVTSPGRSGAYKLGLGAAPQFFAISLPLQVSNGVPSAGAGNLEGTASEDHYSFSRSSAGSLQVNMSSCQTSLVYVSWKLIDRDSGTTIGSATNTCGSKQVASMPAGNYKLVVTSPGRSGTYKLWLG